MQATLHCMFSSVWDASCTCYLDGTIASSTPHLDQLLGGGHNLVGSNVCSLAANDFDAGRLEKFLKNTIASGTHQALHFQCNMRRQRSLTAAGSLAPTDISDQRTAQT